MNCAGKFKAIAEPHCNVCWIPLKRSPEASNRLCGVCIKNRPLYSVAAAPYIYEGLISEAVQQFKYGKKTHMADSLGWLLASFARTWLANAEKLLTMPVPLHSKRLRERGFNQSLLLASHVARELGFEMDYLSLRRTRHTSPQMTLGMEERRLNVRRAFTVVSPEKIKDKRVLLIDDVATTGTTLNECAFALKKAGALDVLCLTLAKADL